MFSLRLLKRWRSQFALRQHSNWPSKPHIWPLRQLMGTNSNPLAADELKKSLETVQKELDEMKKK
jgi:hypothetical protein